jgi:hypothetical protein
MQRIDAVKGFPGPCALLFVVAGQALPAQLQGDYSINKCQNISRSMIVV